MTTIQRDRGDDLTAAAAPDPNRHTRLELGMTVPTPEVAARRVMGATVLADFTREAQAFADGGRVPDWLAWSHRLAQALAGMLGALTAADPPPGAREAFQRAAIASSGVAPDGSGRLSPADLLVVLAALDLAVFWGERAGERADDIVAYRRVSRALGDDR